MQSETQETMPSFDGHRYADFRAKLELVMDSELRTGTAIVTEQSS